MLSLRCALNIVGDGRSSRQAVVRFGLPQITLYQIVPAWSCHAENPSTYTPNARSRGSLGDVARKGVLS